MAALPVTAEVAPLRTIELESLVHRTGHTAVWLHEELFIFGGMRDGECTADTEALEYGEDPSYGAYATLRAVKVRGRARISRLRKLVSEGG